MNRAWKGPHIFVDSERMNEILDKTISLIRSSKSDQKYREWKRSQVRLKSYDFLPERWGRSWKKSLKAKDKEVVAVADEKKPDKNIRRTRFEIVDARIIDIEFKDHISKPVENAFGLAWWVQNTGEKGRIWCGERWGDWLCWDCYQELLKSKKEILRIERNRLFRFLGAYIYSGRGDRGIPTPKDLLHNERKLALVRRESTNEINQAVSNNTVFARV